MNHVKGKPRRDPRQSLGEIQTKDNRLKRGVKRAETQPVKRTHPHVHGYRHTAIPVLLFFVRLLTSAFTRIGYSLSDNVCGERGASRDYESHTLLVYIGKTYRSAYGNEKAYKSCPKLSA